MDLGDYNIQTSKFVFLGVFYCELLTPKFKNIRWFFFFLDLDSNFNTMDLVKFLEKNQKLYI
jgi:hypothetical protein